MRFFSLEPMESLVVGETMTDEVSASDAASSLMNQLKPTAADLLEKLQPLGVCALVLGTAFCICANLLTLFLLLRCRPVQRSSRTTNLYVLSLCLADLGVGCVAMPLALLNGWWPALASPLLCQTWQLADLLFSTVSLYSICAIACDRVWNLEQPLRVFTRSRRRAKRLMLAIWLMPLCIWLPVYFWVAGNANGGCMPPREVAKKVFWVSIPVIYVPAAILICLFLRISLVVHRHLKFLREHSSTTQIGPSYCSAQVSPYRAEPIRNRVPKHSVTVGHLLIRTPGVDSPRKFRTAKLSESVKGSEDYDQKVIFTVNSAKTSSTANENEGNGRRIWRQRTTTTEDTVVQLWRKSPTIIVNDEEEEKMTPNIVSEKANLQMNCSQQQLEQKLSLCSRPSLGTLSDNSSLSSADKKECLLRKLSASFLARRGSSSRFSMVAFSENLSELLQREGITQQVKAAKAVGLILFCFLLCWFPFLLVWPLRIFSPESISECIFHLCLWLNYACSTCNPLLYALANPKVRAILCNYVFGCKSIHKSDGSAKNTRRSNTGVFI